MKSFFEGKPTRKIRQRAVAVGVYQKAEEVRPDIDLLDEIVSLCRTAGARVVGRIIQHVDRFSATRELRTSPAGSDSASAIEIPPRRPAQVRILTT